MKSFTALNVVLCAILGALLWLSFVLEPRHDLRAYEFLPEMIYPVAAESFAAAAALPGGIVEQRPVAGSIARGRMPLHLEPGPEGAARAALALSNPLTAADGAPTVPADVERGSELFRIYCLLCHGPEGKGDGPVARRGFPAPPSLLAANALGMSDGQLFHIASVGQGTMPSHSSQIDPLDRWRIILRIRQLQAPARQAAALSAPVSPVPVVGESQPPQAGLAPIQEQGEGR